MKKIYLAGFDVFDPDPLARGASMKDLCLKYGYEGLYPLDNEADCARDIYEGNLNLIRKADYICANLNPFRGKEPDSGTCFEIGYSACLGKKIYLYRADGRSMREVLGETDENGYSVENFGFPVNLMMACAAKTVIGTLEDCLKELSQDEKEGC